MKIFHGGCHGCTRQDRFGVGFCSYCCYHKAEWDRPDLSDRDRTHRTRPEKKPKVLRVEVVYNDYHLTFKRAGVEYLLFHAVLFPSFIGFEYDNGGVFVTPRIESNRTGVAARVPKFVLFAEEP